MKQPQKLIIIGGSAGSLSMVLQLLPKLSLKQELCLVLVFHRKESEMLLIDLLRQRTELTVKEAEDKESLEINTVYVAPADYHLLIEKDRTFSLDDSEKVNHSRPSIDVTFESGADAFKNSLTCILLSGANADGVQGLLYAQKMGSRLVVQSPESAEVKYMPQQALNALTPDAIMDETNMEEVLSL